MVYILKRAVSLLVQTKITKILRENDNGSFYVHNNQNTFINIARIITNIF